MTDVGDSFSWPFQTPGWFGTIILQGLIALIPIVGWIALAGWMALTIDNYRAGRRELAPAGFHLERGAPLFLVYIVYTIVVSVPGSVINGAASSGHNSSLSSLGGLVSFGFSILLAFITPAVILSTYRSGINGGFDITAVWQLTTSNASNSVIAGVLIWVSGLIAGVGFCLCCVGLLFTIPYAVAVNAGIVTWYERVTSPPPPLPA